jgi:hypothetical protein
MSLTKQHFELIAQVIAGDAVIPHARVGRTSVRTTSVFKSQAAHAAFAGMMADTLAETNPKFDRGRFVAACQPRWTVGTRHAKAWEREITR